MWRLCGVGLRLAAHPRFVSRSGLLAARHSFLGEMATLALTPLRMPFSPNCFGVFGLSKSEEGVRKGVLALSDISTHLGWWLVVGRLRACLERPCSTWRLTELGATTFARALRSVRAPRNNPGTSLAGGLQR